MLQQTTWRPQPWVSQAQAPPSSLYGQWQPHQAPASNTSQLARASTAQCNWAPSIASHVQDFVPPAALRPISNALRNGHTWFNSSEFPQPGTAPSTGSSYAAASGTSDLSRLPFFRSQVLKQESDAASPKKQSSKDRTCVIKVEAPPAIDVVGPTQAALAGSNENSMPARFDISQAAYFPSLGKRTLEHLEHAVPRQPPEPIRIYVQSQKQPHGFEAALPYNMLGRLALRLPKLIAPASPELVRSSLPLLKPMIVYAQYECDDGCRSRGICVHFSFLLGCRQLPDGLICPTCQVAEMEKPYAAQRICPRHNKRTLSQFTPNLPEDYLPSTAQLQRAFGILQRACNGDWEGIPAKVNKRARNGAIGHIQDISNTENTESSTNSIDGVLPSIETNDLNSNHVRKKRRVSTNAEVKARKYSRERENDVEETSESAGHVIRGDCDSTRDDPERTPRASTTIGDGDHVDADAMFDSNPWAGSLPPWSPESNLDLFS